jgi:hypothetical protein
MYRISPFTPIFFKPSADRHGIRPRCVHVFSKTDRILIELIATGETTSPPLVVSNVLTGHNATYQWKEWVMNESTTLYFRELQNMDEGTFTVSIGNVTSEAFVITSDQDVLADTVLLQYSNSDNRQRNDAVFWIDGMQRFFDFRAPGGFKDDNWTFAVSNEQFVTSDNDKIDLYGQESTIKALTLGNSDGCPVWFADLLNRVLCCNYFYVDGVRYARNESEVPEMNAEVEGLRSYIFKQGLQRVLNLDAELENRNLLIMRRTTIDNDDKYRVSHKVVEAGEVTEATFNIIV